MREQLQIDFDKIIKNSDLSEIDIEVAAVSASAKKAIEKVNGKISIKLKNIKKDNKSISAKN